MELQIENHSPESRKIDGSTAGRRRKVLPVNVILGKVY